jgi:hypothetical protein
MKVCVDLEATWMIATVDPLSFCVAFNLSFILILP